VFARRSGHAIAIHFAATGRTGVTIAFVSFSFWVTRIALPFTPTIFGRSGEALTVETASTWRTRKAFAFEFAAALASESLTFISTAFGSAFESLAFEPATFGRTGKAFTIVATPWRRTVETAALGASSFWTARETAIFATAAFEAWAHRWT
jgi:hypothetical protein